MKTLKAFKKLFEAPQSSIKKIDLIFSLFPGCKQEGLKNVKNALGGVLLLVKLQAKACKFTKSNTPPWVFFTFLKLYEWYQIAQSTTIDLRIFNASSYLPPLFYTYFTGTMLHINNISMGYLL